MKRVGLVEACDDPQLFGFPLWPENVSRQRELLAQVDAGPRLHVWALGRRSSKTTMSGLVGLWSCLLRPELLERLRPGERGYAVAVAVKLDQARLIVQAARSIVERSPLLHKMIESQTEDEILFRNGTAFTAFPCSSRSGRGWPIFTLLMDEASHFLSETEGPQVAERVFEALVPSTAQFGELARIIVGSTPYGTSGLFADLFERARTGELPNAVAVQEPTSKMNPTIDADFLALEETRNPESFRGEYLAEFVGSGGAFLDSERVRDAIAGRAELAPDHAVDWIAGLDPAFQSDPFGLAIVGREPFERKRLLTGLVRAWKPQRRKPASFEEKRELEDEVLAEVAAVCKAYRARVVTDQFAAPSIVARLQEHGLSVRIVSMGAATKTDIFTNLRARLYMGELELYDDTQLLLELRRLRTKYSAGSAAVINPRVGGSHGDLAQALALAVAEHRVSAGGSTTWKQKPDRDAEAVWARLERAGGDVVGVGPAERRF